MQRLYVLLFSIIFLFSCEKETHLNFYIDNKTSGEIIVEGNNLIAATKIDQTIGANDINSVAAWSKRGKGTEYVEPIVMFGNILKISNTFGDTLTKDYKVLDNWEVTIQDFNFVSEHEYIFVIQNSDF